MHVPQCNRAYEHSTVALHLHDYVGILWIGQTRLRLQPGDITLSPNQVMSRYELEQSGHHLCVHFHPIKLGRGEGQVRLPLHLRLGARTGQARERFWRVIDYHWQGREKKDSAAGCAASACLQEFLLWLHLQRPTGKVPSSLGGKDVALAQLGRVIEESLAKLVTIPELVSVTGLSADYAARLFRERYGMTLPRYLLLKRIELARHLLISSDLPVQEVGRQSGIPDPQYFNKQFRAVTGQSPSAYRLGAKR